jgi:hypothetical protein
MKKTMFLLLSLWFSATVFAAQGLVAPVTQSGDGVVAVTLGQSVIALNGPWKFRIGDSPIDPTTHKWLWAEPRFDDSRWETVDLAPVPGQYDNGTGDPHWVRGWMARGHAGYSGWAWYRLRVKVASNPRETLAIDGPNAADDAWQLFAGGQLLGSSGKFDSQGKVQRIYFDRPLMFPLPPVQPTESAQHTEDGVETETFAFRVWMSPMDLADPNAGGLHDAPLLEAGNAMKAQSRLDWQELLIAKTDEAAYVALFLLLAALAASLTLFDPSDRVYLWIAATMLISTAGYVLLNICTFTTWLDARTWDQMTALEDPLQAAGWVMVWWVWFRHQRPSWVPRAIALLTVVYAGANTLKTSLIDYGIIFPYRHNNAFYGLLVATPLAFKLAFLVSVALIVTTGIRKAGKEGWWTLIVVVAMAVEMFAPDFGIVRLGTFHGIILRIWDVTDLFLVAVLAFLMLRRLLHSLERQRQMAADVRQAQELQQVILPRTLTKVPGLVIESEYRPAREVGGDFFQIIPHKSDGSVLIVAGDVTGKGLKAGMLVALLVGVIQNASETTAEPLEILSALNRTLLGRGDAQATCLALRIANDGSVTLANAGHLPPYLNAEPLQMEGALPLGMIEAPDFSVMRFRLAEDDHLMLLSDGIVEATDAKGNLFGFERIKELLCRATSASELATAAQNFGQEDDITVLSLVRVGVKEQPSTFKTDTLSTASA